MNIAEWDPLFNLIGTTYGGDGVTTFALPDLRGRVPIHQGQGSGLSPRVLAEKAGVESVTLTTQQIPAHTHTLNGSSAAATSKSPAGKVMAVSQGDLYTSDISPTALPATAVGASGGSQPHDNMQPYLCISFIISLYGIYPN